MRRRSFLKLTALASLATVLKFTFWADSAEAAPRTADFHGKRFRGDRNGRIFVSADGGLTWQLHTNLGPQYAVRRLRADRRDRMHAMIKFQGRSFGLVLAPNEQWWLTT